MLSNKVITILGVYFDVVDEGQIGDRLVQVWDALSVPQQTAMQALIKDRYFKIFDFTPNFSDASSVQVISDAAEILTPTQRTQLFNLIKTDIIAVYNSDKDAIDSKISDVTGTTVG